jgi:twitching motility protein PilT
MSVKIDDLLVNATAHFASDLHLKAGSFPIMRIGGELYPVAEAPRLSQEDTLDMAFSMMSNRQKQKLKEVSEVDIAYSVGGLGRFRANIFSAARHGQHRFARHSRSEQDNVATGVTGGARSHCR